MEILTRREGEVLHVILSGRLDAAWSGTAGKRLDDILRLGSHQLMLDLGAVEYLSSAGIRVLMLFAKRLQAIGASLRLGAESPQVRNVLEMVGFHRLIEPLAAPPSAVPSRQPPAETWYWDDRDFEVHTLDMAARRTLRVAGEPLTTVGASGTRLRLGPGVVALGLGSLGADAPVERAGELLAAEGLVIALPGDDAHHPDWLTREGELVPEIRLQYGLYSEGAFRHLLRFETPPDCPALALSRLAGAALERGGGDCAVLVVVAETACLVGAALQISPDRLGGDWFGFPEVRERLAFTAEPVHADTTCLIVGIVARDPGAPLAAWLRPLAGDPALLAHCHAAIFPYRPVRKGCIELGEALAALIESQAVRGVLHLLNDDRPGIGAGESLLRRGAVWCAPARLIPESP